jgi:hypothetical protein
LSTGSNRGRQVHNLRSFSISLLYIPLGRSIMIAQRSLTIIRTVGEEIVGIRSCLTDLPVLPLHSSSSHLLPASLPYLRHNTLDEPKQSHVENIAKDGEKIHDIGDYAVTSASLVKKLYTYIKAKSAYLTHTSSILGYHSPHLFFKQ